MSEDLQIYSIKDVKSGKFLSLELFVNDLECERFIKMQLKNGNSVLSQFPEDFVLYRLGTFSPEKGIQTVNDEILMVCNLNCLITPSLSGNEDINKQ